MVTFDEAIPRVSEVLRTVLGIAALAAGDVAIVRDPFGLVTVLVRVQISDEQRASIIQRLLSVSPYSDHDQPLVDLGDVFDDRLSSADSGVLTKVTSDTGEDYHVYVIDHRVVGLDWLAPLSERATPLPTIVFSSLKGGVGRSTALVVTAAHLANRGLNVLAIDLDLEAPGIGSALLREQELPDFGSLDYFVENKVSDLDYSFFGNCVGVSSLTTSTGVVHVVPAIGSRGRAFPQNIIPKISRAYIERPRQGDELAPATFLSQVRAFVQMLTQDSNRYDVILVDSRAGMHESTPASIIGVGGLVLLFGTDNPQTFDGFEFLLAGLGSAGAGLWRHGIHFVHAKASTDVRARTGFRDKCYDLAVKYLYEEAGPDDLDAFNFDLGDPSAPHYAWDILNDSNFLSFDPLKATDLVTARVYEATFGDLLRGIDQYLGLTES